MFSIQLFQLISKQWNKFKHNHVRESFEILKKIIIVLEWVVGFFTKPFSCSDPLPPMRNNYCDCGHFHWLLNLHKTGKRKISTPIDSSIPSFDPCHHLGRASVDVVYIIQESQFLTEANVN